MALSMAAHQKSLYSRLLASRTIVLAPWASSPSFSSRKASSSAKAVPAKGPRNSGLTKPVDLSPALQQFLGSRQATRADTMKLVWEHIKRHDLQSASDRKLIICDEKLKGLLGKDQLNVFTLAKWMNHALSNGNFALLQWLLLIIRLF